MLYMTVTQVTNHDKSVIYVTITQSHDTKKNIEDSGIVLEANHTHQVICNSNMEDEVEEGLHKPSGKEGPEVTLCRQDNLGFNG